MSMRKLIAAGALLAACSAASAQSPNLGKPISPEDLASWDISIGPDGAGLPAGSGTVKQGEATFAAKCQPCHNEKGAGTPNDRLVGGQGTLAGDKPAVKTVGSYWPYATTLFDYVRRAMPLPQSKSLSNDEVYAVAAYILNLNGVIGDTEVINAQTLPKVKMPNRDGRPVPFHRGNRRILPTTGDTRVKPRASPLPSPLPPPLRTRGVPCSSCGERPSPGLVERSANCNKIAATTGRIKRSRSPASVRALRSGRSPQWLSTGLPLGMNRRTLLKAGAAVGAAQIASLFVIAARGETPIKIGMVDPLTGVYAAVAQNEVIGARLAVDNINAKGGVLGRQVDLLVEDSANDVGTGVQKTRKLIERDQVSFVIGDVNSGIAQAMAQVTAEKKVLHVVSGGHTDGITGKDCKVERLPRLQHDAHGGEFGFRPAVHQVRQEVALHHAGLCVRPHPAGGLRGKP